MTRANCSRASPRSCRRRGYIAFIERLWAKGGQPLAVRIEDLVVTRGRKRDNIGEHRAILEAIRRHDPAAARRAMRAHLRNAERQRMVMLRKSTGGG